jgi:uncharacterized membrane protein
MDSPKNTSEKTEKEKKMNLLIIRCFLSFFALVGLIVIGHSIVGLLEARASLSWQTCEGTVTHSEVQSSRSRSGSGSSGRGGGSRAYGASIRYNYTVDGKEYTGNTYQFGDYSSTDPRRAKEIVEKLPVGAVVKVYYSRDSPEKSVLVPGPGGGIFLMFIIGIIFFLIGAGILVMIRVVASLNQPIGSSKLTRDKPEG